MLMASQGSVCQVMDALLLLIFVGAPLAFLLLTRSTASTVLSTSFVVAFVGGLIQITTSRGGGWSLVDIQWVLAVALLVMVALAAFARRHSAPAASLTLGRQLRALWVPVAALVIFLATMRALAADQPSILSGISFLVNHPVAEDNAKWLNLTSQLAAGDELSFVGGYAGGALTVVLAFAATVSRVVSIAAYGGVNEVGVTVQAVIGSSYLLVALAPLALAPLVEAKFPPRPASEQRGWVPAPAIWAGALILATGSAALTIYGHLSLQLVLLMLVVWIAAFLARAPEPHGRLLATGIAVSAGVVWFPLNIFSLVILAIAIIAVAFQSLRRILRGSFPDPWAWSILLLTTISAWDGLVSSTIYALGIGAGGPQPIASGPLGSASVPSNAASLFASPGGTEVPSAVLTTLAVASVLGAAALLGRTAANGRSLALRLAPVGLTAGYAVLIGFGDAILTASGENYPTLKMGYAAVIILASATAPLAITALAPASAGMTVTRWTAVGAVVFVLASDSLLPRSVGSLSPKTWEQPTDGLPYWSVFEVQATSNQPIAELPIACTFLPPGAQVPTGNIDGQRAYNCTRLLVGLNGRDARDGSVLDWIRTDWLSNGSFWNDWAPLMSGSTEEIRGKRVVLLGADGNVIGLETLQGLLDRYPPEPVP